MHEPDWEALSELQFLLYSRIANGLAEALSSIALSTTPDAQEKPPGFWQDRAADRVANILNLFTAWSTLIEYKVDCATVERALRPFRANQLLAWLAQQLQLSPPPRLASDPLLHANQETLQEALLLLHSAAHAYGSSVRLELEASRAGVWFHLKFRRHTALPDRYEDLLNDGGGHWRARQTAFELAVARDFVHLNASDIQLGASATHGEFLFFVRAAGAAPHPAAPPPAKALDRRHAGVAGTAEPDTSGIKDATVFQRLSAAPVRTPADDDAPTNASQADAPRATPDDRR